VTRARKTIAVSDVRDLINGMLADSNDDRSEGRTALAVALETILMNTGNYRGYQALRSEYLPADQQTADRVLRDGYDDTRRRYF